jgi:alkylation response protein AidB-like acyl-CoA dehydrogenase
MSANPLFSDRDMEFVLHELLDASSLCEIPAFSDHSRETFDLYLGSVRKFSRDVLFPTYRELGEAPPELHQGAVKVHPKMGELFAQMAELGIIPATRPEEVGGQSLPMTIATCANAFLMAANLSVYGYAGLTLGAARLIESFGSADLKATYLERMYTGEWTGTMALTEPQAGSSLTDVQALATPTADGHYLVRGTKIFISGGDQDFTDNIVHLTLARIEGAPPGIKGVSLFAIPKFRPSESGDGKFVPNDAKPTGLFHKIGWKALPSIALTLGDENDCHGWLVGEPNRGIHHMFQMMNEARLMVGLNGVATATVAYHEAVQYAKDRPQGRSLGNRDPESPQIPIIEHSDVRRMLLRQKSIVEGALSLVVHCALLTDISEHSTDEDERRRTHALLELLIPVAKSFPAEKGFESNALAVQVHGGYGYTSEYLPESWLRDQKLNSLHEGTTGIHSLDLLGRKVSLDNGYALHVLRETLAADVAEAKTSDVPAEWISRLEGAATALEHVTLSLLGRGAKGDVAGMLLHSVDYLDLFSTIVIAWQWLRQATAAKRGLAAGKVIETDKAFYEGKLCAAQYWINSELPRVGYLAALCQSAEDSYARMDADWF